MYINNVDEYFNNLFKNVDKKIYLDLEQREVILDNSKKLMVIAGAGSGKTTTMSAKVKYLVEIKNINPKYIIMVSFTNRAVDELKERINNQFKIPCEISTFHSLAYSILNKNGCNYKIESNPHKIVENYLKQNKRSQKILKNPQYCVEIINLYKNKPIIFHKKTLFYNHFMNLYNYYNNYMMENNMIDFEDIINKCYELLKSKKVSIQYKYIIIDEFQDISLNRYRLIELISKLSDAKIIVVGDDWQTIFSFAGSDIHLFNKFAEESKILKITNTYRNSQQLIDIAGSFIMKNNTQIKKHLRSNKNLENVITICGYFNNIKCLCLILDKLVLEFGIKQKILLIGRYNFDIIKFVDNKKIFKNNSKISYYKYPELKITFLTAHASKGLGYDNVVILNANKGEYGFPSLKKVDKLKKIFLNNEESYLYSEERRLFYVALTRTKNKVYILYKCFSKSVFVKELNKYKQINTKIVI